MSAPGTRPPESGTLFAKRRLRVLYLALVTGAVLALAYRLRDALNPLLLALLIAYMMNPLVRFLESGARLPRTLAVLVVYACMGGGLAALAFTSVGKTAAGIDHLVTKAAGGWQILPPGVEPRTITTTARLPDLQVFTVTRDPNAPTQGFIDLNQNHARDPAEPAFERVSGKWVPVGPMADRLHRVPGTLDHLKSRIADRMPQVDLKEATEALASKLEAGTSAVAGAAADVWNVLTKRFFGGIATVLTYIVLVPVYCFFMLRGFDAIVLWTSGYLPGLHRRRIESILGRIDRACAAFFRGRFLISVGKGLITFLGLYLAGIDFSLTIGITAAALSIIPAAGPTVGMGLAVVASYGPDGAWGSRVLAAGIVFVVAEVAEAIANPIVLGREVGLHPVTLLVSFFIFGDLFGFFGVLLAVPLAAIVKILGEEFVLPELDHLARERPDGVGPGEIAPVGVQEPGAGVEQGP